MNAPTTAPTAARERDEALLELAHYREVMPKLVEAVRAAGRIVAATEDDPIDIQAIESIREALALIERGGK